MCLSQGDAALQVLLSSSLLKACIQYNAVKLYSVRAAHKTFGVLVSSLYLIGRHPGKVQLCVAQEQKRNGESSVYISYSFALSILFQREKIIGPLNTER